MVDKNLFLYDLAVVAIMKNEEPYVKEWLDYHLLAGVDHFYIYDNDSTPEFKKILQPYIDAGVVTYTPYPGKARQFEAYNDAFQRFKFECRYMAIIDGDEFIFPKSKSTISEVADEILSTNPNAAALGVNWMFYGSNGQEKANYTIGVLDRFIARDVNTNRHTKPITNPRQINFFQNSHYAIYFDGKFSVNEEGKIFTGPFNEVNTANKIVVNHYHTKSYEEYLIKRNRGDVIAFNGDKYSDGLFRRNDKNDVVDDSIVKYRDARKAALIPEGNIEKLFAAKQINYQRLFNALNQNLIPTVTKGVPQNFFDGKVENFLTCLKLIAKIKDRVFDETSAKFFEEVSLNAIHRALHSPLQMADVMLLIGEMPKILLMNYPAVKNIRDVLLQIIPQVLLNLRMQNRWQEFKEMQYNSELLKIFKF